MRDTYKIFKNRLKFFGPINSLVFRSVTNEILKILKDNNSKTILDVCCGSGNLSGALTENNFKVTGIDMSNTMLDIAKKKKRADTLIFMDATKMEFYEEFDATIIQIALHEMSHKDRRKVLGNMKNAVNKGGVFIIVDFSNTINNSVGSMISGYLIKKGERAFLNTPYSEHYYNYKKFMKNGGLKGFLKEEKMVTEKYFMGGHVGVISIIK